MVEDVRQQIQVNEDILPRQQVLFFARSGYGTIQLENGRTLSDYDISNEATLRLVVMSKSMLIFVCVPLLRESDESIPFSVDPTDTIESVKKLYLDQTGIPLIRRTSFTRLSSWRMDGRF